MSGKKILIIALGLCLVGLLVFGVNKVESPATLGGIVVEFNSGSMISSTTILTADVATAATIITAASNTGKWFRIANTHAQLVWCNFGTTISTSTAVPLLASSTDEAVFSMIGYGDAITCVAQADALHPFSPISYSYTGE